MVFGARYVVNAIDLSLSNQILFLHGMEKKLFKLYLWGGLFNLALKAALFAFRIFDPALCIATTCLCDVAVVLRQQRLVEQTFGKALSPLDAPAMKYALFSLLFYPVCAALRLLFPLRAAFDAAFFLYLLAAVALCAALYAAAMFFTRDAVFFNLLEKLKARFQRKSRA